MGRLSVFFMVMSIYAISSTYGSLYLEGLAMPEFVRRAERSLKMAIGQAAASHRVKRKTVIVPLTDPDECIGKCAQAMHDRVNHLVFHGNDTDAEKMMKFCQTYAPFGTCFPKCPASKLKALVSEFFPVMNVLCELGAKNYTEVIESFDCLDNTRELAEQKCEPKCGAGLSEDDGEAKVHLNILPNFVIYDNNQTRNTHIISETCSYLSCMDKCSEPIIEHACGAKTVQFENRFVATMLASLLNTFREINAIEHEPKECKPLITPPKH